MTKSMMMESKHTVHIEILLMQYWSMIGKMIYLIITKSLALPKYNVSILNMCK